PELVEQGLMLATALTPLIGYEAAAKLAKAALSSGKTIRQLALEEGFDKVELSSILDPSQLTGD
ncbi:MAG: aspartate ammonia-lyase, partial [Candidatus Dormibacteraceae bacterium]